MTYVGIRKQAFLFLGILTLSITGATALTKSTPYGLGLVNDSAAYIGGAMNLLDGKGYSRLSGGGEIKPITHFPPLYSILLTAVGLTGINLFQAARILNILLFATSVILVGISVHKISASALFAIFGSSLLALSDVHLEIYAVALSEPLFLTLMLAAYLMLAGYFVRYQWQWLVLAGFTLGLAYLARYAAISLWITAVLTLIILGPKAKLGAKRSSLPPILILLGSGLPLMLIWFVMEALASGGIGNRLIAWHPISLNELFETLKNLLTWLAPDDLLRLQPFWGRSLSALSLLFLPAIAVWLIWNNKHLGSQENRFRFALAITLGLHIIIYFAFLVISKSLLDASIPFNDRLLSVIYIPGIILFASGLAWLWQILREQNQILQLALLVLCVGVVAFNFMDGMNSINYLSRDGVGFTNRGWRESPALQGIERVPPGMVIYSDRPTAIFLLTGRSAYTIPTSLDPVTLSPRSDYALDLERMHSAILSGKAVMVLFDLSESQEPADIRLVEDLTDGLILRQDYGTVTIYGR